MRTIRPLLVLFPLAFGTAQAQTYGLLLGASATDLRAAGVTFEPGKGISLGVFVPFYVNDRLVLRAETGLASYTQRVALAEETTSTQRTEAQLTALCRFYLDRKLSLSLGAQGLRLLHAPATMIAGKETCTLRRTQLCAVFGAAYRWSERVETGIRYAQGALTEAELPTYGPAKRRFAHITMSYLLHGGRVGFAERRKWRSGLSLSHRY